MSDDAKFGLSIVGCIAAFVFAMATADAGIDSTEQLPTAEKGCYVEVTYNNRVFGEDTKTIKEFCETRKDTR